MDGIEEDAEKGNCPPIKLVHSSEKPKPNGAAPAEKQKKPPTPEEVELALAFVAKHKDEWRYVAQWTQWFKWTGQRWEIDQMRLVAHHARLVAKENKGSGRHKTFKAIELIASAEPEIAATVNQWDSNFMQNNTPSSTVCLKTGERRQPNPLDYCTKLTAVGPGGKCERWMQFLNEIFDGNEELIRYIQKVVGYCLTGLTTEQQMWFFYGTGANGKSVFLSTVAGIFGDYAATASVDTFTSTSPKSNDYNIAKLQGARLVTVPETEEGRGWKEAEIKRLTGSDRVDARHPYGRPFDYIPQFKLIVCGNHKPTLRTVDEAMRRRMNLIPFSVTIPEDRRDPDLFEKLKLEWPGILKWMIEGCLLWQRDGLAAPQCVKDATSTYLAEEDFIGQFTTECCVDRNSCSSANLYKAYKSYTELHGETVLSQKQFNAKLESRGYEKKKRKTGAFFENLSLIENEPATSWSNRHDEY